jgi:two-component system, LuxR family, sensor kinase FixL
MSGHVESILAAIVESSDDAIIGKNLDGIITSWNQGAERMYGYEPSEIVGQSIARLIPDDRDDLPTILEQVRHGVRVASYETVRLTKDRRRLDVSLTVSPIRNRQGEIVGASAIARDVTERRRSEIALHASEARWRAVFESAVDGIVVIDANGIIQAINPAGERLFGFSGPEVVGRNVNMLMPSPYHAEHDGYIKHYLDTGERHIIGLGREVTGLRRDGSEFPLHLSVGEIQLGAERGFTGILHDLSARVRSEQHLREQAALAKIGEMAAVLAHEVKNPLTAVSGAIQIIGDVLEPGSQEAAIVTEILARLDTLNELTNDLLLFARPPRPSLEAVEIVSLLQSTAGLLAADPSHAAMEIEVSGAAPEVFVDAELLKIVFQNLLLNAAHAMNGHGRIRIGVQDDDTMVRVSVADQGPGIPLEVRANLFQPFFTTKARGTGLGLSTAKRLIEAQRGSIEMLWPASGGTTVVVCLPKAPA